MGRDGVVDDVGGGRLVMWGVGDRGEVLK